MQRLLCRRSSVRILFQTRHFPICASSLLNGEFLDPLLSFSKVCRNDLRQLASTTLAFSFGSLCWATFQGRWRFNVLRSGNVRLLSLRITFPFYRTFRPAYLSATVVLALL